MPNYAIIRDGNVLNVVIAESVEDVRSVTDLDIQEFPLDLPFIEGRTKYANGEFFLEPEPELESVEVLAPEGQSTSEDSADSAGE